MFKWGCTTAASTFADFEEAVLALWVEKQQHSNHLLELAWTEPRKISKPTFFLVIFKWLQKVT